MTADCLIVVLGDSPRLPSGLARIASDLTARLFDARARLGTHVLQIGWEYGRPPLSYLPWPLLTFPDIGQDWGASQVFPAIATAAHQFGVDMRHVVLLTVWDPARCFEYRDPTVHGLHNWGYFAVDGHNRHGSFGGPAAETVQRYSRVLAYTEYGARVLHKVLQATPWERRENPAVSYLPHGHTWDRAVRHAAEQACEPPPSGWRLGCVATNQPRKDLGLFFAVLAALRAGGEDVSGWLHTDEAVTGAWSIPELLEVYQIDPAWCLVSTGHVTDDWLQAMYASCAVTLAPGRGEGFGYPIVESYAMGRPVVHVDYAGGAELTLPEGRVRAWAFDDTNPYVIRRPLLDVTSTAARCAELAQQTLADPTLPAFYAGTVAHLHWDQLWPRWETWVRQGLQQVRTQAQAQAQEHPHE